jgi:hypothetical protein
MTGQTGPAVRPLTATCPGCLKSFTCQLPVGDNWTLCPLCGEKFLAGRDSRTWLVLEGSPRKTDFGRTKVIGDGGRIDLGYATDKVSQVYEIGILEYLPGQKKKIFLYAALAVFVFLVFWARIVISSWQAAGDLTDDNPQAVLAATTVSYDDRAFYQDILKFRKWSKNRTFADYVLSQPDMSTRLYKYAIARLSPDSCQEFTSLTLNSRPRGAITMVGTCFQERLANPVLDIDFKDRQAVFSVPESREVIQKDIFPSEPDNGLDGANNPK